MECFMFGCAAYRDGSCYISSALHNGEDIQCVSRVTKEKLIAFVAKETVEYMKKTDSKEALWNACISATKMTLGYRELPEILDTMQTIMEMIDDGDDDMLSMINKKMRERLSGLGLTDVEIELFMDGYNQTIQAQERSENPRIMPCVEAGLAQANVAKDSETAKTLMKYAKDTDLFLDENL